MKLAISTLACPEWSLDQIVAACRSSGIEGIDFRGIGKELDITGLPEFNEGLDATLRKLRDLGIAMPCLNTSVRLIEPDAGQWIAMLEEVQRYARLAARCATQYLRI